jgi:hypothetical protein
MSIKITPDHRDRQAYVYVRQSTAHQLPITRAGADNTRRRTGLARSAGRR